MLDFIQFAIGKPTYYLGLLKQSPMLVSYLLKRTPNSDAKQKLLTHYFSQYTTKQFETVARTYAKEHLPRIIRPKALDRIQWHQKHNHRVVIVSASAEDWLKSWAENIKVELIASQLDKSDGMITGRLQGDNCHGAEKVARLKTYLNLNDYHCIYAYGDSPGDKEMLALADEAHYKPFH
jgi:HAD superfamily hydrolase (TIGR01490 family)